MSWTEDVASWAIKNERSPERVEAILLRKGWNPEKYRSELRKDLYFWLDQWYTLSVKKLPQPATRRNPFTGVCCPTCGKSLTDVGEIYDRRLVGFCGHIFHALDCSCPIC